MPVQRLLLLVLLLGCSSSAPPEPAAPSAPPTCTVTGHTLDSASLPLGGLSIEGVASEAIDERRSLTVGRSAGTSGLDGAFSLELPCGADVTLDVAGWVWLNPPLDLRAGEGPAVSMILGPKLRARLSVVDDTGRALPAVYESSRDGSRRPIPFEGLQVVGMEPASPAATIHVDGFPPRPWTFERSDEVERHHAGEFEVTVVFGATQARWIELGKHHKDVRGAWCLTDQARGEQCKLEPSAIRCHCAGPVAVAGPWDVAWIVPLEGAETAPTVPPLVERCLPGDRARPAGVDGGLVLEATFPPGSCIHTLSGQRLEARVDGAWQPVD